MDLGADLRGKVSLLSVFFDDCPKGIRENFLDLCTYKIPLSVQKSGHETQNMPKDCGFEFQISQQTYMETSRAWC